MTQITGFVVIHRSMLKWGWHNDPATGWLFVNLIMLASHAPSEWKGIKIQRGQLITGRKSLAEQTGLSERQIRTALEHLKSTGEVTIKATNKYSLITIANYGKFQNVEKRPTNNSASNSTNDRPATDHIVTNKQDKQYIYEVADAPSAKDKRFIPPMVGEVMAYCKERGNGVDPQKFIDYYTEGSCTNLGAHNREEYTAEKRGAELWRMLRTILRLRHRSVLLSVL